VSSDSSARPARWATERTAGTCRNASAMRAPMRSDSSIDVPGTAET
jgi:hypothetical protein